MSEQRAVFTLIIPGINVRRVCVRECDCCGLHHLSQLHPTSPDFKPAWATTIKKHLAFPERERTAVMLF